MKRGTTDVRRTKWPKPPLMACFWALRAIAPGTLVWNLREKGGLRETGTWRSPRPNPNRRRRSRRRHIAAESRGAGPKDRGGRRVLEMQGTCGRDATVKREDRDDYVMSDSRFIIKSSVQVLFD